MNVTCLKGYGVNTWCCRSCKTDRKKKRRRKERKHTLITVITKAAGLSLGLKFPDAHSLTPICQTHTQTHAYAIKVRLSKPPLSLSLRSPTKATESVFVTFRVRRQHRLSCSGLAEGACPHGAPVYTCSLSRPPTLTSTPRVTCWREKLPGGRRNLLISPPCPSMTGVRSGCSVDSSSWARACLGRFEEGAEEASFLKPCLCFMNKETTLL